MFWGVQKSKGNWRWDERKGGEIGGLGNDGDVLSKEEKGKQVKRKKGRRGKKGEDRVESVLVWCDFEVDERKSEDLDSVVVVFCDDDVVVLIDCHSSPSNVELTRT